VTSSAAIVFYSCQSIVTGEASASHTSCLSLFHICIFFSRIEVLKRLHLIDDKNFVLLKGKVALEISMSELIITELIIENVFSQMQPCEIVSLLSGIVYQQKSNQQSDENFLKTSFNNAALDQGRDRMVQIATQLNNVQKECQLQVFICGHLVYMWTTGLLSCFFLEHMLIKLHSGKSQATTIKYNIIFSNFYTPYPLKFNLILNFFLILYSTLTIQPHQISWFYFFNS
jgi:hypothetical protein